MNRFFPVAILVPVTLACVHWYSLGWNFNPVSKSAQARRKEANTQPDYAGYYRDKIWIDNSETFQKYGMMPEEAKRNGVHS